MTHPPQLAELVQMITSATGPDDKLDASINAAIGPMPTGESIEPAFTRSVDACIELIEYHFPHGHWHVGFDPRGIEPYAGLSYGNKRLESQAPTVPLALLSALIKALIAKHPTVGT